MKYEICQNADVGLARCLRTTATKHKYLKFFGETGVINAQIETGPGWQFCQLIHQIHIKL